MKKLFLLVVTAWITSFCGEPVSKKVKFFGYQQKPANYITIQAYNKEYKLYIDQLERSVTLFNLWAEDQEPSDVDWSFVLSNIPQNIWENVILPALESGQSNLSSNYTPQEWVDILRAAHYLDIEYLFTSAMNEVSSYLQKNIDSFAKNTQVFDVFTTLPSPILNVIIAKILQPYKNNLQYLYQTFHASQPVISLAFSSDGFWLASGLEDGTILIWNVDKGIQKYIIKPDIGPIVHIKFRTDSDRLLLSSNEGKYVEWDIATNKKVGEVMSTSPRMVLRSIWAQHDNLLATVPYFAFIGHDKNIRLWLTPDFSLKQALLIYYIVHEPQLTMKDIQNTPKFLEIYNTFGNEQKKSLNNALMVEKK
jgi:WD40 repeat protein